MFTIKDLGYARYFLGVEISRSVEGTFLCQRKYIKDIIDDTYFTDAAIVDVPLNKGHKFQVDLPSLDDAKQYRRLIGRLLYLNLTRPDIMHFVQQLSQYVHTPCVTHMEVALHVVKYLKGTTDLGLFYTASSPFYLEAYCDSDWASCPITRRSLSGYCIFLGDNPISWKTKKQPSVTILL